MKKTQIILPQWCTILTILSFEIEPISIKHIQYKMRKRDRYKIVHSHHIYSQIRGLMDAGYVTAEKVKCVLYVTLTTKGMKAGQYFHNIEDIMYEE